VDEQAALMDIFSFDEIDLPVAPVSRQLLLAPDGYDHALQQA
jgi:hypothetical protein